MTIFDFESKILSPITLMQPGAPILFGLRAYDMMAEFNKKWSRAWIVLLGQNPAFQVLDDFFPSPDKPVEAVQFSETERAGD